LDREYVLVIYPIDGMRAFISGVPVWGTLIGMQKDGRAIMGMIEQPFTGERYFADQNGSIYTGPEGERRLATRQCDALSNAILFTTSPHLFAGEEMEKYREIEGQVRLF
ncbi:inositol monophosphatase family protein, partial [Rhizobium ruizarguesonis]